MLTKDKQCTHRYLTTYINPLKLFHCTSSMLHIVLNGIFRKITSMLIADTILTMIPDDHGKNRAFLAWLGRRLRVKNERLSDNLDKNR